jgi:phosphoribosylformylglycinamidine cyclo-ligase
MGGLTYSRAGVDTSLAANETQSLARILQETMAFRDGAGSSALEHGYYASAIRINDELALGICTDGVGSKLLVAELVGRYDTVGIDCVAMNVNDLICIGAEPLCMVDYVGVERLQPGVLAQVAEGLREGARQARITIPGGETAQLPEIIRGHQPGHGLDLVGTAVGLVPLARLNCGRDVLPGDVVVGLRSSGVHSNGLTLARRALFDQAGFDAATERPELGRTVGEELLEPTRIYVREAMELFAADIAIKAMCHITGDGLLNLTRVAAPVGWVLDDLPPPHPIFDLIAEAGQVETAEMYRVFNMGIGLCVVVAPDDADRVGEIAGRCGAEAHVMGRAVEGPAGTVRLPQKGIVGSGTAFAKD